MKVGLRACFSIESLRWIMRISLRLKRSSSCSGLVTSNDNSWVVEKEVLGFLGGSLERERERSKARIFTLLFL